MVAFFAGFVSVFISDSCHDIDLEGTKVGGKVQWVKKSLRTSRNKIYSAEYQKASG
ncbi:MAG: hypothetical protein IKS40_09555 [Treponema sp.]|nr:hypothetical protein [Treponema sp.]